MKQTQKKNEKGFTMIELIIVVAIMGIIGAVLVPMFGNMSEKARLTSDITSIKTLQRQLDIYKAEVGSYPDDLAASAALAAGVLDDLVTGDYLDAKDLNAVTGGFELKLQTGGTVMVTADSTCILEVDEAEYDDLIDDINATASTDGNKGWVRKD